MRNYAKVGGRKGMPGYRTPSSFRSKVFKVVAKIPKGKVLKSARIQHSNILENVGMSVEESLV